MVTHTAPYVQSFSVDEKTYNYCSLKVFPASAKLPVCLRILLENVLREAPDEETATLLANRIIEAGLAGKAGKEIPFMPARVLYQDFTGVPVFCDFAAMRDAAASRGANPKLINPQIPCTLVIDHSVMADVVSCTNAADQNERIEAARNAERFQFLKWSAHSFNNVRIVPPGQGICHQLNVEHFCRVIWERETQDGTWAYFDTLVGTDSHTPTANGMGTLGWGVGGIEAEAAALGQPCSMMVPPVIGVKLTGSLQPGVSAMDVALTFAERLRALGVVGSLAECFGPGVSSLSVTQRATIANMTPEYGATATYFPPDEMTLHQLESFGRDAHEISLARAYLDAQGLFDYDSSSVIYSRVLEINLADIEPSLAGPSRPHDRLSLSELKNQFLDALSKSGHSTDEQFSVSLNGETYKLYHGAVAIAAITSCTTATDPSMMVAAGLTAQHACKLGCEVPHWVKKILAPGSHAVTELLDRGGLLASLEQLGFDVCGYGCMSCIGNSGPIAPELSAISNELQFASVLSGNRNFEGRISPDVAQNYLMAPALVLAYALAGRIDIDLTCEPVCEGTQGPVMLRDLLPSAHEVDDYLNAYLSSDLYSTASEHLFEGGRTWELLDAGSGDVYNWDETSTYVRRPPFMDGVMHQDTFSLSNARILAYLGDFVTTDHISPAGTIASDSPAATYLRNHGIAPADFNSYGSRRGNHEVMMRGTFANIRLNNYLASGKRGGYTTDPITGKLTSIFEAAEHAQQEDVPLIVLAGKMYGSGSSRDWAAKGPALLGVRAVIAESFERIHRSNLIGMGIVPLQFLAGDSAENYGLNGYEEYAIEPFSYSEAGQASGTLQVSVTATSPHKTVVFPVMVRLDTPTEAEYLSSGGILPYVVDRLCEDGE